MKVTFFLVNILPVVIMKVSLTGKFQFLCTAFFVSFEKRFEEKVFLNPFSNPIFNNLSLET